MKTLYIKKQTSHPLSCHSCGHLVYEKDFLHHRRTMDQNVFILVLEGILHITVNDTPYDVVPSQYIFLKAGWEHYGTIKTTGALSYLWVHFDALDDWDVEYAESESSHLPQNDEVISYRLPLTGLLSNPGKTEILFHQLIDISLDESSFRDSMQNYALSQLLMQICSDVTSPPTSSNAKLYLITNWIRTNCYRDLTNESIAAHFGYNQEYLSSLFKKEIGSPLTAYLTKCRIDLSKQMLSSREVSIKEVAYSTGFRDEKYFMRTFKKSTGLTPSQYRDAFYKDFINT